MTDLLLPPGAVAADDTEAPIQRFAEILHTYDPRYTLEYVPEREIQTASVDEILKPFRIVETTPELGRQVVRYLSADEMKRPDRVLAWVWEGDFKKHRPGEVYDRIEKEETARKMLDLARERDEAQARIDYGAFLLGGGREKKHRVQLGRGRYMNTGA